MKAPSVTEPLKAIDTAEIFQALHTPYIVFSTDDPLFTVIEENEAHARLAMVERSATVGKPLLDAFSGAADDYKKGGSRQLVESIRRVIKTKKPDSMPRLKYGLPGKGTVKHWSVIHYPIFGKNNRVIAVYQDTRDITDDVQTSQKLDRAEHQLSQLLASSLIGTWSWDITEGKVRTDANLAKMFGISRKVASKGLPLDQFLSSIHPDDQRRVQVALDKTLKTHESFESEYRTVAAEQETRWVIARGYIELDKTGKASFFSGIIFDITDRKRAERALVESEKRLRFMADSLPQLCWTARPDGYREYFNKRWYEFTGTIIDEVEGDGWHRCVHPEDKVRVAKAWEHSYTTGETYEIEYRLYHAPTKSYRWVIGRALPFRNDAGKIVNWYGTSTDIDEQKRATQVQEFLANVSKELAETLDYSLMLEKVTRLCVPVVADWCSVDVYDKDKGFEQVSIAHADPKKIPLARAYRKRNPIHIDDQVGVAKVLRTGEAEYYPYISDELLEQYIEDEEQLMFMKGLNLCSLIIVPIRVSNKIVGGISFVSSDSGYYYGEADLRMIEELASRVSLALTNAKLYDDTLREVEKRHKIERELLMEKQSLESRVKERTEQRVQHLVALGRSKDEFISIASHQLRTPATGVKQYVGMLLEGFVGEMSPDQLQVLQKAYDSNERQLKIVTDLLRVAQVDAGKVVLRKREVKLNKFIDNVIRDQYGVFSNRHQTIRYTPMHPDITISIDDASMRMVLENIIDNASKYSQEHTHVTVTAEQEGDMVTINVGDQGVGINPKGQAKLFEKFSRINNALSTKVGGTGLGLYWAKKIVDLHGGKIYYVSNHPKGTTFTIELPKDDKV